MASNGCAWVHGDCCANVGGGFGMVGVDVDEVCLDASGFGELPEWSFGFVDSRVIFEAAVKVGFNCFHLCVDGVVGVVDEWLPGIYAPDLFDVVGVKEELSGFTSVGSSF